MKQVKTGTRLITEERQRQINEEGYTLNRDEKYTHNELTMAAKCYLEAPKTKGIPDDWPWSDTHWKPTPNDRVRELTKAGALIAAEIDRLERNKIKEPVYRIGNRFKYSGLIGGEYILSRMDIKVALICLDTGSPFSDPVEVENPYEIRLSDFKNITDGECGKFTLIDEGGVIHKDENYLNYTYEVFSVSRTNSSKRMICLELTELQDKLEFDEDLNPLQEGECWLINKVKMTQKEIDVAYEEGWEGF